MQHFSEQLHLNVSKIKSMTRLVSIKMEPPAHNMHQTMNEKIQRIPKLAKSNKVHDQSGIYSTKY